MSSAGGGGSHDVVDRPALAVPTERLMQRVRRLRARCLYGERGDDAALAGLPRVDVGVARPLVERFERGLRVLGAIAIGEHRVRNRPVLPLDELIVPLDDRTEIGILRGENVRRRRRRPRRGAGIVPGAAGGERRDGGEQRKHPESTHRKRFLTMRPSRPLAVSLLLALCAPACAAPPQQPPQTCTAEVNAPLGALIARGETSEVDGVAVCGVTFGPSRPQRAGAHGGHQLIPLRVPLPDGSSALVEVVSNDDLDGPLTAPRGATIFALGQYYRTTLRQRPFVAGIHDVHCATHRGAANGYVIVNGRRFGCGA